MSVCAVRTLREVSDGSTVRTSPAAAPAQAKRGALEARAQTCEALAEAPRAPDSPGAAPWRRPAGPASGRPVGKERAAKVVVLRPALQAVDADAGAEAIGRGLRQRHAVVCRVALRCAAVASDRAGRLRSSPRRADGLPNKYPPPPPNISNPFSCPPTTSYPTLSHFLPKKPPPTQLFSKSPPKPNHTPTPPQHQQIPPPPPHQIQSTSKFSPQIFFASGERPRGPRAPALGPTRRSAVRPGRRAPARARAGRRPSHRRLHRRRLPRLHRRRGGGSPGLQTSAAWAG